MNGIQLTESDTERYLGVFFSTNLNWKNQVITACNKANQMLTYKNNIYYLVIKIIL